MKVNELKCVVILIIKEIVLTVQVVLVTHAVMPHWEAVVHSDKVVKKGIVLIMITIYALNRYLLNIIFSQVMMLLQEPSSIHVKVNARLDIYQVFIKSASSAIQVNSLSVMIQTVKCMTSITMDGHFV